MGDGDAVEAVGAAPEWGAFFLVKVKAFQDGGHVAG